MQAPTSHLPLLPSYLPLALCVHASHPAAAVSRRWFHTHKFPFLFSFFPLISNCAGQLQLQHCHHLYLPSCARRRAGYPTRLPPPPRCFNTDAISTSPHLPPPCATTTLTLLHHPHPVACALTATNANTRHRHRHPASSTPAAAATLSQAHSLPQLLPLDTAATPFQGHLPPPPPPIHPVATAITASTLRHLAAFFQY